MSRLRGGVSRTIDPGKQQEGCGAVAGHHLGGEVGRVADRPLRDALAGARAEFANQMPVHAAQQQRDSRPVGMQLGTDTTCNVPTEDSAKPHPITASAP